MRIRIDHDRCTGHQMCAIAAGEVFGSDDYGNVVALIEGEIPEQHHAAVRRAVANCPERAIEIAD